MRYFYRTKVPCLVVSTKGDQFQVEQNFEHQPVDFCLMHQLPRPIPFRDSDIGNATAQVFTQLATMAVFPHLKRVYFLHDSNLLSKLTLGAAVAALAGFLIYKNL
ncbi:EF hand family protein [Aphelenchoides avenae]|nr:EF hand family protein [Aphelenchus avenae]